MRKGAEWLIKQGLTKSKPKSIVDNITASMKRNGTYLKFKYSNKKL